MSTYDDEAEAPIDGTIGAYIPDEALRSLRSVTSMNLTLQAWDSIEGKPLSAAQQDVYWFVRDELTKKVTREKLVGYNATFGLVFYAVEGGKFMDANVSDVWPHPALLKRDKSPSSLKVYKKLHTAGVRGLSTTEIQSNLSPSRTLSQILRRVS